MPSYAYDDVYHLNTQSGTQWDGFRHVWLLSASGPSIQNMLICKVCPSIGEVLQWCRLSLFYFVITTFGLPHSNWFYSCRLPEMTSLVQTPIRTAQFITGLNMVLPGVEYCLTTTSTLRRRENTSIPSRLARFHIKIFSTAGKLKVLTSDPSPRAEIS